MGGDKKRKKRKMAAPRTEIKDFSADEFADEVRKQCRENEGRVSLSRKDLTDESMARLAQGLLKLFSGFPGNIPPLKLKKLFLDSNDIGSDGLGALAGVLSRLPRCRETLEILDIGANGKITTLAPLAAAGGLEGLKVIYALRCSLSGDSGVLPPELCANLPALKVFELSFNKGDATITLTKEALCALPAECRLGLQGSKVQVARPSPEDGEMGLVALPTGEEDEFGAYVSPSDKTVAKILIFADVYDCNTYVKPARPALPRKTTGMRCGACSSPHPRFACAACKQETYCDDRCQKLAWASHKNACFNS